MKTYRVHKNTRWEIQNKVYEPLFWLEDVICTHAEVSEDGSVCTVKYTYYNEIDDANVNVTIIDRKNQIIEYREYEIDNTMVKTIYDCKEYIVEPFYFPVVETAYEE